MKKVLFAAAALLGLLVLGVFAGLAWLVHSLDTPEFQKAVLERVRQAAGADVRVERMDVSLLSGLKLEGISVRNPSPFSGDLLTAQAFVLRYRLWPLVSGRFEVDELRLSHPVLAVAMDAQGRFNYERLGGSRAGVGAAPAGADRGTLVGAALPLRLVLSRLVVDQAAVVMTDATRARLLSVEAAALDSAFQLEQGVLTGTGRARVRTLSLGDLLFVRDLHAPLRLTKTALTLTPLRGRLAGGEVAGEVTVQYGGGFRYSSRLELKGARVKTLLSEAGSAASADGALSASARFQGTGPVTTIKGSGQATIADCRVNGSRSLALLANVLGLPELAKPDFEECRVEFEQRGYRVAMPVLSLKGAAVALGGKGTLRLDTSALDYDLTLALAPAVFARLSRKELRPAFHTRPDGWASIDFRLTGTTLEPKTDLLARVGRGAAEEAVKQGLGRLLGRKKVF
jgi:hypothetical protein